jgi:Tol biopolymer transport system component
MDASGRNKTRVGRGANLRLTPDGQQLTFIDASGTPTVRIRSVDEAGDAREVTADGVRPGGGAHVSPDGRWIGYSSFDDQKRPAITVCDFPSCTSKRTLPIPAARWTPDSKGLAYLPTPVDIWIQPLDGGAARQLTHFPADGQQIWGFAFAADGRLAVGRASIRNNIILFRGLKPSAR